MKPLKQIECRYCENGRMVEEHFEDTIKIGRSNFTVKGLLRFRCENCASEMTTLAQHDHNLALATQEQQRSTSSLPISALRDFRDKYGLSQRDAGRLIGAGEAAFGKYESGGRMSGPTAKLVRVGLAIPEVVEMLAAEENIELSIADTILSDRGWIHGTFKVHSIERRCDRDSDDACGILGRANERWIPQRAIH